MSSSHRKEAPTTEALPCPECGHDTMHSVVESCVLAGGLRAKNLAHLKCSKCGARFFGDAAMHEIQALREKVRLAA